MITLTIIKKNRKDEKIIFYSPKHLLDYFNECEFNTPKFKIKDNVNYTFYHG